MFISGITVKEIELINHSNNYELHKDGHSAFYDHEESLEETVPDFEDYLVEATQMLVNA